MGHAGAIVSRRPRDRRVEGRGARGRGVPGRRLPHRAAGAAARRRLPRLTRPDGRRSMNDADIRYLFEYDRWATRRVLSVIDGLPEAVWGDTGVIGERGLGAILVHQLGAHQRWRHGLSGSDLSPVPEREPLPSPAGLAGGLGGRVGRARGVAADAHRRVARRARRWRSLLADARPRREPRHPAPRGGGGDPHGCRAVARRPRHDLLRRGARGAVRLRRGDAQAAP